MAKPEELVEWLRSQAIGIGEEVDCWRVEHGVAPDHLVEQVSNLQAAARLLECSETANDKLSRRLEATLGRASRDITVHGEIQHESWHRLRQAVQASIAALERQ